MLLSPALGEGAVSPFHGELRYGLELARLLADREFLRPSTQPGAPPVLLIPGFMAGDGSLGVMASWLRRRGSRVGSAGMLLNVDCSERSLTGIEARLRRLAESSGRRAVVLGQSRGGEQARVLAVRHPELVSAVVMLGSPVLSPLSVGSAVLTAVRSVAWLGDHGIPGALSHACGTGACCASYRDDIGKPIPDGVRALTIYSRSDGIVSWEACLDPCAEQVEVDSSHCGMSANPPVYRVIARFLDEDADRSRRDDTDGLANPEAC